MILYYVLVFSFPLIAHQVFGMEIVGITVSKWLGGICMAYAISELQFQRTRPLFLATNQARAFLVLFLLVIISYFTTDSYSADDSQGNLYIMYASHVMFCFTTLVLVNSEERLRGTLLAAIGGVAFAALYVLREWQTGSVIYGTSYRPGYVTGDPNFFTVSAVLCLPVAFCIVAEPQSKFERRFCIGCITLILMAVMVASSRGGFLGLVAAILLLVLCSQHRIRNLVMIGGLLLAFLVFSPSSPLERFLRPAHHDIQSQQVRILLWEAGMKMIRDNPIAGVGVGNFRYAITFYQPVGADEHPLLKEKLNNMAHNSYIDIAAELGVPGFIAFMGMLYWSLQNLTKLRHQSFRDGRAQVYQASLGIQAGLFGAMVAMVFVSAYFLKLVWLMIFLTMCLPALGTHPGSGRVTSRGSAVHYG